MGIPILVKWHLYIESGPWSLWLVVRHTGVWASPLSPWTDLTALLMKIIGRSSHLWPKSVTHVKTSLIARFMGPTWGLSGVDRTQVGPMLAPWTLLSGICYSLYCIEIKMKAHKTLNIWRITWLYQSDTNSLHNRMKILKIRDIFELSLLIFVYQNLQGDCPPSLKKLL